LLLSVWGGVIADRVDRRKLVVKTRSAFAGLAFLTAALIVTGWIQPWHIIAISLGTGILLSFDIPSRQAMLPGLVDRRHLPNAIALYSSLMAASAIIGPSVFAPLVNLAGLEGLFFLIGLAYLLTAIIMVRMSPVPVPDPEGREGLWREFQQGIRYIRGHRMILSLIGMGIAAAMFGLSMETLLPTFAEEVLGGDVNTYSLILLGLGLGALVGTALLAWLGNLKNSVYIMTGTGIGFGVALVLFAQAEVLWLSVAMMGLIGATSVVFLTANQTLIQSLAAEEFRGRVMSVHQLAWGSTAIGGVIMGFVAQTVDAPFAVTLGGVITGAVAGSLALLTLRGKDLTTETDFPGETEAAISD
jgi:MFS family permease